MEQQRFWEKRTGNKYLIGGWCSGLKYGKGDVKKTKRRGIFCETKYIRGNPNVGVKTKQESFRWSSEVFGNGDRNLDETTFLKGVWHSV